MLARTHSNTAVMRTWDAARVNAILNDPAVLPGLGLGFPSLDISGLLADSRNLCFLGEYGGAILVAQGADIYEAHDFILPAGRGKWALAACRNILSAAFDLYGARLIYAKTPIEHRACRLFNRMLGFTSGGTEMTVLVPGATPQEVEIFTMRAAPCL